jgi:hypothetical protein
VGAEDASRNNGRKHLFSEPVVSADKGHGW